MRNYLNGSRYYTDFPAKISKEDFIVVEKNNRGIPTGLVQICKDRNTAVSVASDNFFDHFRSKIYDVESYEQFTKRNDYRIR